MSKRSPATMNSRHDQPAMRIGELSQRTGVSVKNLRQYTDWGLIHTLGRTDADPVWWERLELGPDTLATGDIVEPARSVDVPTALRLDFDAGPVWFVCANPEPPAMEEMFTPGDEIMIVSSRRRR